jgi:hypothetical protein
MIKAPSLGGRGMEGGDNLSNSKKLSPPPQPSALKGEGEKFWKPL